MDYISKILDEIGVDYEKLVNGNAIVVTINGNDYGKCIAIRADSDASTYLETTFLLHQKWKYACLRT